jgi:hypothetical protein
MGGEAFGSSWDVKSVAAAQAAVVGQHMTVKFFAKLSAHRTAASSADEASEDGG